MSWTKKKVFYAKNAKKICESRFNDREMDENQIKEML
jgi:hypothetical protein